MNGKTASELKSRIREIFSFILLFCPDFQPETQTSIAREFDELIEFVVDLQERTKNDAVKQWLGISLQEIRQSREHYKNGDAKKGRDLLQRAEQHFKNAFAKRSPQTRFVVGETGPAQDTDAGFPS